MRFLPRLFPLILLAMLLAVPLTAGDPIVIGERVNLRAENLQEDRTIWVSLPRGYAQGQERYPVLYLTDGDAHFTHTRGTLDFLAQNGLMPEVILVGILNTQRTRDLTPTAGFFKRPDGTRVEAKGSGGAKAFLEFIEKTLVPYVESNYRTQPFRIFAGHSFGGLFALYALVERPQLFQAIISVSPSLNWDERYILKRLEALFKEQAKLQRTLVVTMADEEGGEPRPNDFDRLRSMLKRVKPEGFISDTRHFPEENHGSLVLESHHLGLRKIFDGWRLPVDSVTRRPSTRLPGLQKHYQKLSQRLGYAVVPPELLVNQLGYLAVGEKQMEDALALFRYNVEAYPASANVHDSLGEALEGSGKPKEAAACYAEAVKLAEQNKDPRLPLFRQNLERMRKATE